MPQPPVASTTAVQINLGDSPADWIMAFGMTVTSIKLTGSDGTTVETVPTASPMEMMQLMANVQPVSAHAVTQGTYTQATVSFSAVTMGYLDPVSHTYKQKTLPGPYSAVVPFNPAMTVGTTPLALSFDMDMGASVAIDGAGNVTLTPVMTASMAPVSGTGANPWQGTMQHRVGAVSAVAGSQFTMGAMMGMQQATFTTNASTRFTGTGLTSMGSMATGMMVNVDAALQADGSLLAQRVEAMGAGTSGMMGGGLITAITGNPPTQITLAANAGQGGGMMPSGIAGTLTVTVPAATPYSFDGDGVDLASLPFTPAFGATNLAKGQRVEVVSTAGMMGGGMMGGAGSLTASQVRLEQQGLHGLVSAYAASGSQGSFTLTLSADSAFTTLTGVNAVQVYQQAGTQLRGLTTVANGDNVQIRGLLFNDSGTYKLVSTWIVSTADLVTPPAAASTTVVQVNLGDAPADWIMAFGMNIDSITLTQAAGGTVNVVPSASPMEMMGLMANVQPVSSVALAQGTYTQAMVTFSGVSMGYMDPVALTYKKKALAGPFTAMVPFSPAMTVGTSPMALSFDMDMAASVAIDGSGSVTLTPVMTATMAPASGSGTNPWLGTMQHRTGVVSAISGSQFTLGSMMGIQQVNFMTDANTTFTGMGLTGMGSMAAAMMVNVDATLQPDGTYLAQRVESMGVGSGGMMGGGMITAITGNPPTQVTLAMGSGQGGGMMASSIAGVLSVTIPAATPYNLDADGVDLTNLPFTPVFSPATLSKGQRIEVPSATGMMGGGMMGGSNSLGASQVRLVQQGLHGVVSAYAASGSQAVFTLTLSSGSAFTTLTGATSVQVYRQTATQLHGASSVANGDAVQVRGLLFDDAGVYRLLASWITTP